MCASCRPEGATLAPTQVADPLPAATLIGRRMPSRWATSISLASRRTPFVGPPPIEGAVDVTQGFKAPHDVPRSSCLFWPCHWPATGAPVRSRPFGVAATAARSSALWRERSMPFGKYWRSSPLCSRWCRAAMGCADRRSTPAGPSDAQLSVLGHLGALVPGQ